jgi:hypothetical protein
MHESGRRYSFDHVPQYTLGKLKTLQHKSANDNVFCQFRAYLGKDDMVHRLESPLVRLLEATRKDDKARVGDEAIKQYQHQLQKLQQRWHVQGQKAVFK